MDDGAALPPLELLLEPPPRDSPLPELEPPPPPLPDEPDELDPDVLGLGIAWPAAATGRASASATTMDEPKTIDLAMGRSS